MDRDASLAESKALLISRAVHEYREIYPASDRAELGDCFTTDREQLLLWFNTADDSTHVVRAAI